MASCSDCRRELPDDVTSCPSCGSPVAQSPATPGVTPPYEQPIPGPGKGKRGLPTGAVIAIIAGCVTVFIILTLVVLLSISVVDIFKKPADVANAYIKALSEDDLETAWGYLSEITRSEKGRDPFESEARDLGGRIRSWHARSIQIRDHGAQITLDVEFKNGGEASMYMFLVKEAGEWRVRSVAETPFSGFEED